MSAKDWMDETCFSNTFLISAKWHSLRHGSNSSAGCCFSWLVGPLRFTLVQLVETWRGTFSIQAELAIGKFRLPSLSLDANCLKHHLTWNGSYRVLHELVTIFTFCYFKMQCKYSCIGKLNGSVTFRSPSCMVISWS